MSAPDSVSRSLKTTWPRAVSLAATLSQPRTDVEASDAAFAALLQESAIARGTSAVARAIGAAWTHSRARSIVQRPAAELRALNRERAIRTVGWTVVVASLVALVLDAIKPTPVGPLAWVLPALCGTVSLIALFAAVPIARVLGERRS